MITLYIDKRKVEAEAGESLLQAAQRVGVKIPTLCHHPGLDGTGSCRMCMVEITRPEWDGWSKQVTACLYPVEDGLHVSTQSEQVRQTRSEVIDLLLARTPDAPLIQQMAQEYGVYSSSYPLRVNADDCILCGLCVTACDAVGAHAISTAGRGIDKEIATPFLQVPEACIGCTACAEVCPTDCIPWEQKDGQRHIWGKDFAMVHCESCGQPFMTEEERDHLVANRPMNASYYVECESCKRQRVGQSMATVVLKTHPGFTPKVMAGSPVPPVALLNTRKGGRS
jgi:NADH dehydrogenase/NADH:ubiquinone oxidoreductase subunit G